MDPHVVAGVVGQPVMSGAEQAPVRQVRAAAP